MTVAELKTEAKALGIKGYSKMKKDELIEAIKAAKFIASIELEPVDGDSEPVKVAQKEIDINGMELVVDGDTINNKPAQEFLASLKGWDHVSPAGARRRVRKWLRANGHGRLAATV